MGGWTGQGKDTIIWDGTLRSKNLIAQALDTTNLKVDHIAEKTAGHDVVFNNATDFSSVGTSAGYKDILKLSNHSMSNENLLSGLGKNSDVEYFCLIGQSEGSKLFIGGVDGEANRRFEISAAGKMQWGPSTTGVDVNLYRVGLNRLKIEGNIEIDGFLSTTSYLFAGTRLYVDGTHAEALLVRKNSDGGDVFIVDTSNDIVTMNGDIVATGRVSSGTATITASSDTTDVSGINTLFIDITSDIVLGGLLGGVNGQSLNIVILGNFTNHVTLEHAEGIASTQDFINHTGVDELMSHGGAIYVCNGSDWYDASHARHV